MSAPAPPPKFKVGDFFAKRWNPAYICRVAAVQWMQVEGKAEYTWHYRRQHPLCDATLDQRWDPEYVFQRPTHAAIAAHREKCQC